MDEPIVVMGICGSYDLDSANGRMLELILRECRSIGAETVVWDHGKRPLPLVGAEGSWDDSNVKDFQEMAVSADAYVLSSPEYHGTMSGVMKNSLDWLYSKHTKGKVFALVSTLGASSFLASSSVATGAKFSSVTVSGFTSTSIPIFFLIFSAILADLPVLSLR